MNVGHMDWCPFCNRLLPTVASNIPYISRCQCDEDATINAAIDALADNDGPELWLAGALDDREASFIPNRPTRPDLVIIDDPEAEAKARGTDVDERIAKMIRERHNWELTRKLEKKLLTGDQNGIFAGSRFAQRNRKDHRHSRKRHTD